MRNVVTVVDDVVDSGVCNARYRSRKRPVSAASQIGNTVTQNDLPFVR